MTFFLHIGKHLQTSTNLQTPQADFAMLLK